METLRCPRCHEVFDGDVDTACPVCSLSNEDLYRIARDYIYEHPGKTAAQVAKMTNIDTGAIMTWVRQNRFSLKQGREG